MKSKRTILAVAIGGILIAAVILAGVYLISSQKTAPSYQEQLRTAKQYLEDKDYEKAEALLLSMIEENPEESEGYIQLSQMYLEQQNYYDANKIARNGYDATGDYEFQTIIQQINDARNGEVQAEAEEEPGTESMVVEGTDAENLAVRYALLDDIALHCYQQYVNDYGEGNVESAGADGYRVKFGGFGGYAYFDNSSDQPSAVDTVTRKITQTAKPYKVVLLPSTFFVGYEGYISYAKVQELFGIDTAPQQIEDGLWRLIFEYRGCRLAIETDSAGNIYGDSPYIEIAPLNLVETDWDGEEEEAGEEEEEEADTFELGGNVYTYDVTDIYISNKTLSDISELSNCKKLRSLYLINCGITDISPLSGCDSLVELCLDDNPFSDLSPLSGLKNLRYLQFHESKVTDLSPIYDLDLEVLNPCSPGVTLEQVEEYMSRHPDCICFWDYYRLN